MENKKGLSIPFIIIAIILGVTLYKEFDFKTRTFEHTGLAIVYMIGFAIAVFVLVRNYKSSRKK